MAVKEHNLPAGDDAEKTLASPRFDEKTAEKARPVVPLEPVAAPAAEDAAGHTRRPRGLILAAVLSAALSAGATALYFNTGTTAPPAAPQISTGSAPAEEAAPASTEQVRDDGSDDVSGESGDAPRTPESQAAPPVSAGPERVEREEAERRGRDEDGRDDEKRAEHARRADERLRRDEEKAAERERKEAEKKIARGRESEKRGQRKARLVDVITAGPRP
ncbi:MAG TPA: hypothetical protein VFX96_15100 [Pyrinomonadaceae bacterium]|nr:hypothetical protein [Pyrinomonadaceae bacterium]